MAADLARTPSTGVQVQLCGDAHMANFGVFASPERRLLFDVNDFDETTPGPWEWDLKRLATSAVVIARMSGLAADAQAESARATARSYRKHMANYATMGTLDVWYERVDAKAALRTIGTRTPAVRSAVAGAHRQTSQAELPKLTVRTDGGARRIVDHPPLVTHEGVEEHSDVVRGGARQVPGVARDRSSGAAGAVRARRRGLEGGGRGQRGHALLRGPVHERHRGPVVPAGEGGRTVGRGRVGAAPPPARALRTGRARRDRSTSCRGAPRGGRATPHAGRQRHLPGLGERRGTPTSTSGSCAT